MLESLQTFGIKRRQPAVLSFHSERRSRESDIVMESLHLLLRRVHFFLANRQISVMLKPAS